MKAITEDTKVPIRWVFVLLSMSGSALILAMAVGIWSSKIEAKSDALEDKFKSSEIQSNQSNNLLYSIDRRLSRIEGKLGIQPSEK